MSSIATGNLIKKLRTNLGLTIQNIADILGISKTSVSKWESGEYIKTENLFDLAKLLGVSYSELNDGKLNNESNKDYWMRNYDLSNYVIDEEMINKNVDSVKEMFDHCKAVRNRFYKLLPKWANDELTDEMEEFEFLKQYFTFDKNYYAYIKYGPGYVGFADKNMEKEFVKEKLQELKSIEDKAEMIWERSKLYDFTFDYKSQLICSSGDAKAIEYMVDFLSDIQKDRLLYVNLNIEEEKEEKNPFGGVSKTKSRRYRTNEEIESKPYFKIMINAGAKCHLKYDSFPRIGWDKEMLEEVDGKIEKLDKLIKVHDKFQWYNAGGFSLMEILDYWKVYSYKDYVASIDEEETQRINAIVNLKAKKPIEYLNYLERKVNNK